MKELPEKYYLSHFDEFIAYISSNCLELLNSEQRAFLVQVDKLAHDTLCMLVRIIGRRGEVLERSKLNYAEIDNCVAKIDELLRLGLLHSLKLSELKTWLETLNKRQLQQLLRSELAFSVKLSSSKAELVELAKSKLRLDSLINHPLAEAFVVKSFAEIWRYLLFLFFGNLNSGLDKFSMRDLGVLKTRQREGELVPRFATLAEANTSYYYALKLKQIGSEDVTESALNQFSTLPHPPPDGETAERYAKEFYFLLGKKLLPFDRKTALHALSLSSLDKARELWIREYYKSGDRLQVQQVLEKILETNDSAALSLFAEDFYLRKFKQVKVSQYTQMLRESSHQIYLDEIYRDNPERGVQAYYSRQNILAFKTENHLFSALFGLLFWTELFIADNNAVACEFDRRPASLRENRVYQTLGPLLEKKLNLLREPQQAIKYLSKIATQYYGQPNGIFRWHNQLLEILRQFILSAPQEALINHLRAMTQDYYGLKDGYPDLMLIEQGKLKFAEVKAQGDVIRANQLVTIKALQQAGFAVQIIRVDWAVDPQQAYVVIDIETTGGKSAGHRITEVGAVKIVNGIEVDRWSSLIDPQRHIPQFISKLTGISDALVKDAPLFCEVAEQLEKFMSGCVFVAHNVNFDYGFFKLEFERLGRSFSMPKLCTVREMRKYFPGLASYSLGNLCKEFDIELKNHHRALSDAQAAAQLLVMINERKTVGTVDDKN